MKTRFNYLDVAKFIGIFCIYLGHFGTSAGNAYNFVFAFHVPLFFFLSGCTENLSSDIPWYKYILKNIKNILLPFYLFAILSIVIESIYTDTHAEILPNLLHVLKGCIRNQFFAGSLWFLTALFVIKIMFFFLRKLLRIKWLVLGVSLALFYITLLVVTPSPYPSPRLPYNIDIACFYIIFYALGYYCFNIIQSLLELNTPVKKVVCAILGTISFAFSGALFFGKNLFYIFHYNTLLFFMSNLFTPLIVILLVLIVSKLLENVKLFVDLGKNTLFLCGSEYIIKLIVPSCLRIVGLGLLLPSTITTYFYSLALLIICYKTLVPMEKAFLKKIRLLK